MPGGVKLYERKIYSIDRSWRFSLCEDDARAGQPGVLPRGPGTFNNERHGAGYLPYGVGLYRKALAVSAAEAAAIRDGSLVAHVEFDGAQTSTTAYLNGSLLGSHGSGYTNFRFPLSGDHAEALAAGAVLALRVDATQPDGWWYDGGGIYRHARLLLTPATHLSVLGGAYLPSTVAGLIEAGVADAIVSPRIAVASTSPTAEPFEVTKLCETNDTLGDGKAAAALYRELDPSSGRAVSANYNPWRPPDYPGDVVGIDYATDTYDAEHAKNASMPFISSETSSAVSDRGEYASDAVAAHVSGYDTTAPSWGEVAEDAWGGVGEADAQGILTRPFISGGFTWTGFDYKGEPTPYSWPNINSHFGILDIAGFEKDRFYYYQSIFKPEPVAHLFPGTGPSRKGAHLAECEGLCAGSAVEWTVDYAPGTVAVVVRDAANATVASDAVETTGPAAALRLSFKDGVGAGGIDADCGVALVQVEVVDAEGRVVPTADANVTLASSAALRFISGGNGDPSEHTADKSASRPAFHGLLLGVFEATGGAAAAATVTATAAASTPRARRRDRRRRRRDLRCPRYGALS
ncbi:arogenate dehydratase [Aureococcus anophagefferens]|nr:arogenate dehydratase [Aureococcus anophagefferens]